MRIRFGSIFAVGCALGLLSGCTSAPRPAPGAGDVASAAQSPITPEKYRSVDCLARLASLAGASQSASGFVVASLPARSTSAITIEADKQGVTLAGGIPPSGTGTCGLVLMPVEGSFHASTRTVARETVDAEEQVGSHDRLNPAYIDAQKAEREASSKSGEGGHVGKTGDPGLDLIGLAVGGVISGVEALIDWHDRTKARERLAKTPRVIAEPIYQPYRLDLQTVQLERRAVVRIALVDGSTGQSRTAELPLSEARAVQVGRNLREGDRKRAEKSADYVSPTEFRALAGQPPALNMRRLAELAGASLAAAAPQSVDPEQLVGVWRASGAEASAEPSGPAAIPAAAGHPSCVRVEGLKGSGRGIYVGEETVLTSRSLIGDTALIKVEAADGVVTYGILEREDPQLDLALVYIQKRGPAVTVASAGAPLEVPFDAVPGTPLMTNGALVGMAVAGGGADTVDGPSISSFVAAGRNQVAVNLATRP